MTESGLTTLFSSEFTPNQARVLASAITQAYQDLVKTSDFNELKEIVRDLGEAQKRTEIKVEELTEAQKRTETRMEELAEAQMRTETRMEELAEAQKRTETRMEELTEAQKRTETRMEELAEAQKRTETRMEELAEAQKRTEIAVLKLTESQSKLTESQSKLTESQLEVRQTVGSLAETMGLLLENDAYRNLPAFLEREHNLIITRRMIRPIIGGEEIDFLAEAKRGKTPVLVVGEAKTKLDAQDVTQLQQKVEAVKAHYKKLNGHEILPLMIVHRAREKEIRNAKKKGVIVVQSFEW
jgi:myosin heavy subunit